MTLKCNIRYVVQNIVKGFTQCPFGDWLLYILEFCSNMFLDQISSHHLNTLIHKVHIQNTSILHDLLETNWNISASVVFQKLAQIHTWSIFKGSPSSTRASAGIMSPSLILIMSPGTNTDASSSVHLPSRKT